MTRVEPEDMIGGVVVAANNDSVLVVAKDGRDILFQCSGYERETDHYDFGECYPEVTRRVEERAEKAAKPPG